MNWIRELKSLNRLGLSETGITDRFFELAPHLKEIGDLRVNDSKVSQELQDALMKRLVAEGTCGGVFSILDGATGEIDGCSRDQDQGPHS